MEPQDLQFTVGLLGRKNKSLMITPSTDRLPPHSEEIERAVIGSILLAPELAAEKLAKLHALDFYSTQHKIVLASMQDIVRASRTPQVLVLVDYLKAKNRIEPAGGENYIYSMPDAAPGHAAFEHYLPLLKDYSNRRELERLGARAVEVAHDPTLDAGAHLEDFANVCERIVRRNSGTADFKTQWLAHFDKATSPASGLSLLDVPTREPILGTWFREGDLGFIYGARGLGKTWLGLHIARQCAEGGRVADWEVHKQYGVLYVDGEMPLDEIRKRDTALTCATTVGMFYLNHEALFHLTGKVLNLTDPTVQAALLEKCVRDGIKILFLDNLSCLFTGIRENDADDWELVLPWLLELRRNRIAVVFVAHAGRNGFMRGTSRREDAAFWILQLTEANDAGEVQNGARFVARFAKNRNATEAECPPLQWSFFMPDDGSPAQISSKELNTFQQFRELVEAGVTSATDIAEEMGVSTGQVSKLAKKGMTAGWLAKAGREYKLNRQA